MNAVTDSNWVPPFPIETRNDEPVTDSDSIQFAPIESRNDDGLTDHQRAHLIGGKALSRYRDSSRYGKTCAICGGDIGARFAIRVSLRFYNPNGFFGPFWGSQAGLACTSHKDLLSKVRLKGRELLQCTHCGRDVFTWGKNPRGGKFFCCDRCEWNHYNARAKAKPEPHICKVCGNEFIPPRKDAITCSPKCRQKAYRDRAKSIAAEATP